MKNFIKTQPDWQKYDWEIKQIDPNKIEDSALFNIKFELSSHNKPRNIRVETYIALVKRGVVFSPIIVQGSKLLDGTHRLAIYKHLGKKRITVIERIENGTGRIKGKFPYKCTFPFKGAENPGCLVCHQLLNFKNPGCYVDPVPNFPYGLPHGPLWFCIPCGVMYKEDFPVWI